MNARSISAICGLAALSVVLAAPSARADDQNKQSVTVSFGAGLNIPSNNAANHHVLPEIIRIKTGGVVNFVVAGFHQIFVYNPGTKAGDIVVPASGQFINDLNNLYYTGLVPGAVSTTFSTAQNRVESVSFSEPGTYLVICNVRTHFNNGMIAYVEVTGDK
jgi:plastocyanin